MKILSLNTNTEYEISPTKNGENAMACPACSSTRKHTKAKSFSWNNTEMFGYCHEKEIQDEVTIKISCSIFKDGKFCDPFNFSEKQSTTNQINNAR